MTMEVSQKSERNELFSGKGTAVKRTARTVLDTPYTPRVVVNDSGVVANCLLSLGISKGEKQVHWNMLQKMSKEERRRFRLVENAEFLNLRKGMLVGLNEILRGLQRGLVASLIISDKVSWNFMLSKILIESAERWNIPVIKLPLFHELSKKLFGIPCNALGVKKTSVENENSKLHLLHKAIVNADKELKLVEIHTWKDKDRKKPQPYFRSFYSKRKKSSGDESHFDNKMDFKEQYFGKKNDGVESSLDHLTADQSNLVTPKLSEDQESYIEFQHYKPLRVKEVISIKNPPKSKKMKLISNCS